MAVTESKFNIEWDTFHENGTWPTKVFYDTSLADDAHMPSKIDRYNDAAEEIKRLIKEAVDKQEGFRAHGSSWSLSNIAHHSDQMHFNKRMNIKMPIEVADIHASSSYKSENIFFFQCGITVKAISEFLNSHGKSLKATGASNGQTIAGAISTGVHGSAIDSGAIQDSVVGINLIIGPNPVDVVYIEMQSKPALSDAFAEKIKSRVIRNDDLFNAALVSLGSFGFIHGVVIEAEDRFLLKRYTDTITREEAVQLAETTNFADAAFTIEQERDANGKGYRPYHYKVYVNPYNATENYITEIIYKKPYRSDYPDPIPVVKNLIYGDLPSWMAKFAAAHKRKIPRLLRAMRKAIFPALDPPMEGTIGEIFWDSIHRGQAFGCALGVDNKDTEKALNLFIKTVNDVGPIPGVIALRFVKASQATLAFTKFPVTCIIEMDGVLWKGNDNMISLDDFGKKLVEAFQAAGIKFTMHWGKNGAWSFPGIVEYMYGDNVHKWKKYRSALLSKQMADVFSNEFLKSVNLSGYVEDSQGLIA